MILLMIHLNHNENSHHLSIIHAKPEDLFHAFMMESFLRTDQPPGWRWPGEDEQLFTVQKAIQMY